MKLISDIFGSNQNIKGETTTDKILGITGSVMTDVGTLLSFSPVGDLLTAAGSGLEMVQTGLEYKQHLISKQQMFVNEGMDALQLVASAGLGGALSHNLNLYGKESKDFEDDPNALEETTKALRDNETGLKYEQEHGGMSHGAYSNLIEYEKIVSRLSKKKEIIERLKESGKGYSKIDDEVFEAEFNYDYKSNFVSRNLLRSESTIDGKTIVNKAWEALIHERWKIIDEEDIERKFKTVNEDIRTKVDNFARLKSRIFIVKGLNYFSNISLDIGNRVYNQVF